MKKMGEATGWSEGLAARCYFIPGGASQRGGGQAPAFRVARCQTRSLVDIRLGPVWVRQVPSGLVGARRGPVWVRISVVHRYGSMESSVRARWAISAEVRVPSDFRQNPDLARQARQGLTDTTSLNCVVSVYN